MAKNTFLSFSTTAGDNTDVGGIVILGSAAVSNFDNAFRTLMAILRGDLDNGTVFVTKSGAYTALAGDNNTFYEFTATATLSLTAAATLAADWHMMVFANGGAVTVDPNSAELINGAATLTIANGDAAYIICTGTAFKAVTIPSAANLATRVDTASAQTFTAAQQAQARANISAALKGHIFGLGISNNASDTTNDIDIAAGEIASEEANPVLMVLASALTKRLDAAWAVGSGNGGLDTGSIANTTYHLWLIQRSDTGVTDVLFSASPTSPTMPANYDRKAYLWPIIRASGSILPFKHNGALFELVTPVLDISTTTLGTSDTSLTLPSVPTGIAVEAILNLQAVNAAGWGVYVRSLNSTNSTASLTVSPGTTLSGTGGVTQSIGRFIVQTNTSAQVAASATGASTTLRGVTLGWYCRRGR